MWQMEIHICAAFLDLLRGNKPDKYYLNSRKIISEKAYTEI